MNRRGTLLFLLALGAAPAVSFAQPGTKVWRVGFLVPRTRPASFDTDSLGGFIRGMRDLGYVEGRNLVIEWRFADNKIERLPALAKELVALKPDVIVVLATTAAQAMQKATSTLPVVMTNIGDPIESGLVKSLARPEANITGLANFSAEVGPKQLEVLVEILPKVSRVALLTNPNNPGQRPILLGLQQAARQARKEVISVHARNAQELPAAFAAIAKERADALIVAGDPNLNESRRLIAELALKYRLPCMGFAEQAEAGALAAFGVPTVAINRRAAYYVDRIFKGARPGDLPVEQPATFELTLNRKTAKALGITFSPALLLRANKVIE
jgi:putative ABC transport system substrate-binding protein